MATTDTEHVEVGTKLVVRGTFDTTIIMVTGETKNHWKTDAGIKLRKHSLYIAGSQPHDSRRVAPLNSERAKRWLDDRARRMALNLVRDRVKNMTTQALEVHRVLHEQGRPGPIDELLQAVERLRDIVQEG